MNARQVHCTGRERTFGEDEIIVSKTDLKGRITYANQVFCRVSMYTEAELYGKPHSIIRHPGMPRCVFKLLWDTIQAGEEIFAYVINRASNGDHYWVLAHVTPTFDADNQIIGYHSNRRLPDRRAVTKVNELYKKLLKFESGHANPRDAMARSLPQLQAFLKEQNTTYEELVFSL